MRRALFATLALGTAFAAGCLSPVPEESPVPDAGACPAGQDCGGGLLPDAGCPIGKVCPACDAGLSLVDGACVGAGFDAGPNDAGPADAGPPDAGPPDAGPGPGPGDAGPDGGPACFGGTLTDAQSKNPVAGAAITGLDLSGIPIPGMTTSSAADGSFELCPPPGTTFTAQITASNYPVTYFESIDLAASETLGNVPMVPNQIVTALGSFIPGGIIATDAIILVPVAALTGGCSLAGWSVAASLPGGGTLPYQITYLGTGGLPSATLTSTSTTGIAVLYNIDPTLATQVAVTTTNTAPAGCSPKNAALGFTGQVQVAGKALSVAPIILP